MDPKKGAANFLIGRPKGKRSFQNRPFGECQVREVLRVEIDVFWIDTRELACFLDMIESTVQKAGKDDDDQGYREQPFYWYFPQNVFLTRPFMTQGIAHTRVIIEFEGI